MMQEASASSDTAAPKQSSSLFARFSVGDLKCVALMDGHIDTPPWLLAPEVDPAELGPFLAAHGEDIAALKTPVTCLFVELPDGRRLLLDSGLGKVAGIGGQGAPTAGKLQDALAAAGIDPLSIGHTLVSHIHPDHIGGLFDSAGNPNFPNAQIHIPREDADFWSGERPDLSGTMMPPPVQAGAGGTAKRFLGFATSRATFFNAGDDVIPGVRSFPLPGHTPGQVGFVIDGGSETLFFSADAAGHSAISVLKPEWRFAFDTNAPLAIETRRSMLAMLADKGWTTYTPHFPWPGVGTFVRDGDAIAWRAKR